MARRQGTSVTRGRRPLPPDDADELTWLLFRQHDVISLPQALRHLSDKAVRHRVATGRWRQVHRAVLVTHSGPVTAEQTAWIAVLATGGRAILAGISAARAAGLRHFGRTGAVHLLLPANQHVERVPHGVIVHRTTRLDEEDIRSAALPRRTASARSLVDAAQWAASDGEARAIIAAGFQQRLVFGDELHRVLDRLPRARRRRLIGQTAADAAGGAHSLAELDFIGLCRRAGLPEPTLQKIRYDATGRRRYLDAYFERWGVHVEIDGSQHFEARAAWADMRRQNELWIAGDRVLRFPAWAIRAHPDLVVEQVRVALSAAGWPGRADRA